MEKKERETADLEDMNTGVLGHTLCCTISVITRFSKDRNSKIQTKPFFTSSPHVKEKVSPTRI